MFMLSVVSESITSLLQHSMVFMHKCLNTAELAQKFVTFGTLLADVDTFVDELPCISLGHAGVEASIRPDPAEPVVVHPGAAEGDRAPGQPG